MNPENDNLKMDGFPIIKTAIITLCDGQTQYLLPEQITLLVERNGAFIELSLKEIYDDKVINFIAKGLLKSIKLTIIERIDSFDLPWTHDKEIIIGNLLIKNNII